MCLAHWHMLPISHPQHVLNISTINITSLKIISMLSTDNNVTIQHNKYANKIFQQLNNSQIFNKYRTGSHTDPPSYYTFGHINLTFSTI